MNRIQMYIDTLFAKYERTEETDDFYNELIANSKSRYEEYLSEGMSEDEACEKVISHLGDIDSVLAEMAFKKRPTMEDLNSQISSLVQQMSEEAARIGREFSEKYKNYQYSRQEAVEKVFDCVPMVGVNCVDIDVSVEKSMDDKIRVAYDQDVFDVLSDTDSLLFQCEKKNEYGDITLYVPHGVDTLKVVTKSGDIAIKCDVNELIVSTLSGDVECEVSGVKRVETAATSGDVWAKIHGDHGSVSMSTTSGDLDVTEDGIMMTEIQTTSGDIELDTRDESYDGIHLKTISGDIAFYARNVKEGNVKASSISGDIDGKYYRHADRNETTLSTVSGDISLD